MSAGSGFFDRRGDRDDPQRNDRFVPHPALVERRAANDLLDALADLIAERLAARIEVITPEPFEGLVDAREIARATGRSRAWVYEHSSELGAVRLGSGPRPRLGFSRARVEAYVQAAGEPPGPPPLPVRAQPQRRRRAGQTSTGVELLPINGRGES
jgi:predicted DNA-binding transcriptional regulator AlpA